MRTKLLILRVCFTKERLSVWSWHRNGSRASDKANGLDDEKSLVRESLATAFNSPRGGCGRLVGRRVTAEDIASMLARQVDREVLNRTGMSGETETGGREGGPWNC